MANLFQIQERARKLTPEKVSRDIFLFVRTLEKKMADFNRAQLREKSQDVFGNPIGFYSRATEEISQGEKVFGTPFTLFDEGVFLPSIFVSVVGNGVLLFGARDPKTDEVLENLLTDDIFGLSDESLQQIIAQDINPFIIRYYKKNLIK